jgi:hypothetical protein
VGARQRSCRARSWFGPAPSSLDVPGGAKNLPYATYLREHARASVLTVRFGVAGYRPPQGHDRKSVHCRHPLMHESRRPESSSRRPQSARLANPALALHRSTGRGPQAAGTSRRHWRRARRRTRSAGARTRSTCWVTSSSGVRELGLWGPSICEAPLQEPYHSTPLPKKRAVSPQAGTHLGVPHLFHSLFQVPASPSDSRDDA